MSRTTRRWLWALAGAAGIAGLALMFRPKPVPVDLVPAVVGPLRVTVDEDGKTRIKERFVVSAPLAGQLQRVTLKPGDRLDAGRTLLATIEAADPALLDARAQAEAQARLRATEAAVQQMQARLERAKAALALEQRLLTRAKQLGPDRGISQEETDKVEHAEWIAREEVKTAQFALVVSEFEREQAKAALEPTRPPAGSAAAITRVEIRSPITGQVLRVFQESLSTVAPGTRILEIGDASDLEIEIDVLSRDAVRIVPGARVDLEQWGGAAPLQARVRLIEPQAFLKVSALGIEEQRVNVIADLVEPVARRPRLGDGYRVEARIVVWESETALKAPAGALFRHGDGWGLYVSRAGRAELRPVAIGPGDGRETAILSGLDAGDLVIVQPGDRIHEGTAVRPR